MLQNINVIDAETGEIYENVNITNEEDRKKYKDYLNARSKYEFQRAEIQEKYRQYGGFVWLLYNSNQIFDLGVKPDVLTKLIYISTHMKYDNRLTLSNNVNMRKKNLMKILNIQERTFRDFYNSVTEANILLENEDGDLYLNTSIFRRGVIEDIDCNRTRLYIKSIRSLYEQAKVSEHKLLSYLFQAIPFVNVNYNILCFNPLERDFDKVEAMTMKDYCKLIGYSEDNDRRLKTKLKGLRLKQCPVFSFVDNSDGLFCYINPDVYYAGNKWDEVKILGKFQKNK